LVLENSRQLPGERPVKAHPIVARSVDPVVPEKMRVRPQEAGRTISVPFGQRMKERTA
jgi:hypothetical protein